MLKRIVSGIVGGALFVALGWLGGIWLALGLGFVTILGVYEFARLCRAQALRSGLEIPAAIGLLLLAAVTAASNGASNLAEVRRAEFWFGLALILLLTSTAVAELTRGRVRGAVTASGVSLLSGVYVAFPPAYMILLRRLPGSEGVFYLFLLVMIIWVNDSLAYFIGSAFGRHRLAPLISPKKSVEGSLAGIAGSILAGLVYALCWGRAPWWPMLLGAVIAVAGQTGDLFESLLKRDLNVKDSGSFLPGHGGALDRFDSLFFAAPILYYLVVYLRF